MSRVRSIPRIGHFLTIAALAALGACSEPKPTEPNEPTPSTLLDDAGPKLVECRSDETKSETALIGPLGGTIGLDGTSVFFPEGALPGPDLTTVTLTIPASKYVEIRIETNGAKYFPSYPIDLRPIVTIDYSRCRRSDVLLKPLSAWYIDSETKELLEKMDGAIDNKLLQTVTFPADHFSGYAIAF